MAAGSRVQFFWDSWEAHQIWPKILHLKDGRLEHTYLPAPVPYLFTITLKGCAFMMLRELTLEQNVESWGTCLSWEIDSAKEA